MKEINNTNFIENNNSFDYDLWLTGHVKDLKQMYGKNYIKKWKENEHEERSNVNCISNDVSINRNNLRSNNEC